MFYVNLEDKKRTWVRPVTPQTASTLSLPQAGPAREQKSVDSVLLKGEYLLRIGTGLLITTNHVNGLGVFWSII